MSKPIFNTFAEICAAQGKNEQDYIIPADASNEAKFQICTKRLWLISRAYNGDEKVEFANINQTKYTPWHRIIPDSSRLFGFRLSFNDYVFGRSGSTLGARPPFLDSDDAISVGQHFPEEFEQWYYYMNLAYQE